ncbi:hypothetical protein ABDJ41_05735 [Pedobacter sp. ASV1-7]|uniref:hypothetical protein n=1 Tax=Pedobacter sp. ASV1-7 TaxID=3145237 RepID=UPI0032E8C7A6
MQYIVKDGAYGIVHINGKPLSSFDYDEIDLLTEYNGQWYSGIPYNYQFAKVRKNGKYGLIDHYGIIMDNCTGKI